MPTSSKFYEKSIAEFELRCTDYRPYWHIKMSPDMDYALEQCLQHLKSSRQSGIVEPTYVPYTGGSLVNCEVSH